MQIIHHEYDDAKHKHAYTAITDSGAAYVVKYGTSLRFVDTTITVYRVENHVSFFRKVTQCLIPLAEFHYKNDKSCGNTDETKLFESFRGKTTTYSPILWRRAQNIALTFARALAVDDTVTLNILESFENASWSAKADALIALEDMVEQYEHRQETQKAQSEDVIMQQKLAALDAYHDVLNSGVLDGSPIEHF